MKKFLILTGSTGSGHISASSALHGRISSQGYTVHTEDFCSFSRGGYIVKLLHKTISEHLGILGSLVFYTTNNSLCRRIRNKVWQLFDSRAFKKLLDIHKPDHIILTQKSRVPILSSYIHKHSKTFSVSSVFVHYGYSIHALWIVDPDICDHYFVFDPGSEGYLINKYDIPAKQITVSFLPVPQDTFHKRALIGRHKIIMLCTGLNTDFIKDFLDQYKYSPEYNITVIAGRNTHLKAISYYFKTSENILFRQSFRIGSCLKDFDVFVGKPGGAILAECVASETPIICPAHFHGEEDANRDIIKHYGIGFCIKDPEKIVTTIANFDFQSMLSRFDNLKKDSCDIILKTILTGNK